MGGSYGNGTSGSMYDGASSWSKQQGMLMPNMNGM